MTWYQFLIAVSSIFLAERLLPFSIYPFFTIFVLLRSSVFKQDFTRIMLVSPVFDLFSGFNFGFFSLVILFLALSIKLVGKLLTFTSQSGFITYLTWLIFTVETILLFMIKISPPFLLNRWPVILSQALAVFLIFSLTEFWFRSKVTKHDIGQI